MRSLKLNTSALARDVRCDVLRMVAAAKASHVGSCFSCVDLLAVVYGTVLRYEQHGTPRPYDTFIMSKGHAAAGVYATLARVGILNYSLLDTYGLDGSHLMTHVSHKVPGVEFSSGSLGHGLPFGVGKALAFRKRGVDRRVYVMLSDGELDEGSNWEALLFAAHHKLDNLVCLVDHNGLQSLGPVAETIGLEPLQEKFESFGWAVRRLDGHDHLAIREALESVPWVHGRPSLVIGDTIKGKGVSFMEGRVEWHYRSPTPELLKAALAELQPGASEAGE